MTRRVLITGANKGIGKATVEGALDHDDDVHVLLGSRNMSRGEDARAEIIERHPEWAERLEVVQINVSDDESVEAAAKTVANDYGKASLYGIVNNAGIGQSNDMRAILEVNTYGPRRVCETFLGLLDAAGRIVNVSSASGPNYVADCDDDEQALLTNPDVTRDEIDDYAEACIKEAAEGEFERGDGSSYGLSKALLNAYTLVLARELPERTVNACTPGFIETDMTRGYAEQRGVSPEEMGMKSPRAGTKASLHLLFGDVPASGWYFGSDAVRSPMDQYRSPGDPPYEGD